MTETTARSLQEQLRELVRVAESRWNSEHEPLGAQLSLADVRLIVRALDALLSAGGEAPQAQGEKPED